MRGETLSYLLKPWQNTPVLYRRVMNVISLKHNKIYKKGEIIIKLSFKFKPKINDEQLAIIEDLSFHNTGIYINADVNGSLNILKLYIKDEGIPKLIQLARDKGYVNNPVKLRVA